MKIIKEVRLIYSDVVANNNKFWTAYLYEDNSVSTEWGRVGNSSQSATFGCIGERGLEKKKKEKLKKGYTELKVVSNSSSSIVKNDSINKIAKEQIKLKNPVLQELIDRLIIMNVHTITSSTTITYDKSTGLFSTPLGIVTSEAIFEARKLLDKIAAGINGSRDTQFFVDVSSYLRLIPTNVGMKIHKDQIFNSQQKIDEQTNILDSLESSYALLQTKGNDVLSSNEIRTIEKVFDVEIDILYSSDVEYKRLEKNYKDTNKSMHGYTNIKIKNIYKVVIDEMQKAYDTTKGNVIEVYHGTSGANVLSILKGGLKVAPPSTAQIAGKMFGNGIYGATCVSKSLGYTLGRWGQSSCKTGFLFICDFVMGTPYEPSHSINSIPSGYDSCYAKSSKTGLANDELIVYNNNQVNIKFLIEVE